jgi:TonB family protein
MVVVLQFSVLPDGSVSEIHPISRSDQALERAAITALNQWRFEALPPQYGELIQKGNIKFNFKFEH